MTILHLLLPEKTQNKTSNTRTSSPCCLHLQKAPFHTAWSTSDATLLCLCSLLRNLLPNWNSAAYTYNFTCPACSQSSSSSSSMVCLCVHENAKLQKHAAGENVYELIVGTSLDDLTRELTSLNDVKATKCHPKTRNTVETHNSIHCFVLGF